MLSNLFAAMPSFALVPFCAVNIHTSVRVHTVIQVVSIEFREVNQVQVRMEKVMVNPCFPQGVGSFHRVCLSVICNLCCLSFVFQLGYSQAQNLA